MKINQPYEPKKEPLSWRVNHFIMDSLKSLLYFVFPDLKKELPRFTEKPIDGMMIVENKVLLAFENDNWNTMETSKGCRCPPSNSGKSYSTFVGFNSGLTTGSENVMIGINSGLTTK